MTATADAMTVSFLVEGEPIGQQRARMGRSGRQGRRIHWYTPEKTTEYKQHIAQAFLRATGFRRLSPPAVAVHVRCFFGSRSHPDPDNVQKLVLDALTTLAYPNDRHVASSNTHEYDARRPRIEVEVS